MKARRLLPVLAVLTFLLEAQAQMVVDPTLQVQLVVSGLTQPTTLAFIGNDDLLVLQKADGQVKRVIGGVLQLGNVLDVAVANASERGMLGITTDPNFLNNGYVYLYYTQAGLDSGPPIANRVYRYTWDGVALTAPVLVLNLPVTPGPNHNGGIVAFGPDDELYAIIGELNRNGKLQNFPMGPDPDDVGVIYRVHSDGSAVPGNPFYDPENPTPMDRYLAYGIRNSFGFTFDPLTGWMWQTENGPGNYDEINLVQPGFNSGWEQIMGPDIRDPQGLPDLWMAPNAFYSDPEFSWNATVAPTAIVFPSSRRIGCALVNDIIVGDNNCGQLYHFELNGARDGLKLSSIELEDLVADNQFGRCTVEQGEIIFGGGFGVITDVKNGPDGSLYVVSLTLGSIYRISRLPGLGDDADADDAADACDCDSADPAVYGKATEVPRLRLFGSAPALGWDSQSAENGPGTVYDVVTGSIASLAIDGGFASACTLQSGLTSAQLVDVRPDPEAGDGYYYLVRASNTCDDGTFGESGELPDPRDLLDDTPPAACP